MITLCDEPADFNDVSLPIRPRSFRLSEQTLASLDERARELGESVNALAQRHLDEGLRTDRHPGIHFRGGAGGRRAAVAGTRLDVWHVIGTLRGEGGDVAGTAEYFGVADRQIRACLSYYGDFQDEIDALMTAEQEAADRESARAQRERTLFG